MAIKVCPNGHRYDTDTNRTCPYCNSAQSESNFNWSEMDLSASSKTEPIGGFGGGFGGGDGGYSGKTEPINTYGDDFGNRNRGGGADFIGATVPVDISGQSIGGGTARRQTEDDTAPAYNQAEYQHQPVVGWLVCIEGPDKGKDFCLHGAKSTVGRRKDSSVILADPKISREGFPALIVYDDRKSHKFYLASGDAASHNNVELGGNMLLGQSVINPYDEIRIEDTVLVFVPFCGDEFYWKED